MRRLALLVALALALLAGAAAFDWQVDPFGQVWKPAAFAAARADHCLISEELIGDQYWAFKRAVFASRPTRRFVVGSSRVLQIASHPGETTFANLGYPGTAPETILQLFRSLPARPVQTVYVGVEAFWFNARYALPDTNPSDVHVAEYLLSRDTLWHAVELARQAPYTLSPRWRRTTIGSRCVIGRTYPSIAWNTDGSRVWSWQLDPARFPAFRAAPFDRDLATWRNGYYAAWRSLDGKRLAALDAALALARSRGWHVVGFAPPEPPRMLAELAGDPRIAPRWRAFLRLMPGVFRRHGFTWLPLEDGRALGCAPSDFPDAFHSDASCSARIRARLDAAAAAS